MRKKIGGVTLDYTYYAQGDQYNEGDEAEETVLSTFKNGTDPEAVLAQDDRWPVLYQLSERRKNIVQPMSILPTDRVLEIGAGMGAVSGALAQRCRWLDCVELSERRSLANAYRNQTCENIRIFVGNFEQVIFPEQYDVIVMVGVLEYAGSYIHQAAHDPYEAMLKKVRKLLKDSGKLYVAIENRLGIKYFAGYAEDHFGKPFVGVEGYSGHPGIKTFTKSELSRLVERCGFQTPYFYYPFPDYKLPTVIYSDDWLPSVSFSIDTHSYDQPRLRVFDEKKTLDSLVGTEEFKVFSNSFLIEAVKL